MAHRRTVCPPPGQGTKQSQQQHKLFAKRREHQVNKGQGQSRDMSLDASHLQQSTAFSQLGTAQE
eukprot:4989104-Amphidinium_carterae.1